MFRYYVLLVFVLHFADILTTKNYIRPVCGSDHEILKQLAEGTFLKAKKERTREEKSAVVNPWRGKGKFKVVNGKLFFGEKSYDTVTSYIYIVR